MAATEGVMPAPSGDELASLPDAARCVPEAPFRRRSGVLLLLVSIASLLSAFLLLVFRGDAIDQVSVRADTYSRSALGHSALLHLLQELGRPVVQNRLRPERLGNRDALLVVAEPFLENGRDAELGRLLGTASRVLLVLRKRDGEVDRSQPEWIGRDHLLAIPDVARALAACDCDAEVIRQEDEAVTTVPLLPTPTIDAPQLLHFEPPLPPAKVLAGCRAGALVAAVAPMPAATKAGPAGREPPTVVDRKLWILADPDPLANHGIGEGDNAAFDVALLDLLRDGRPIVIDETLHGWELEPSAFAQLGHYPLVLLLAQLLLLTAVIAWIASGRFGTPLAVPPAMAAGKGFLLQNIAELLTFAGHDTPSLRRFMALRLLQTAARLHAGKQADHRQVAQWLAQRGGAAGERLLGLTAAIDRGTLPAGGRSAVQLARDIELTLEEIVHGRG
jgi:hypothetical protein